MNRPQMDKVATRAGSPFFVFHRDPGFLRLGLMIPLDEALGPPFENTWGFLASTGLHLD